MTAPAQASPAMQAAAVSAYEAQQAQLRAQLLAALAAIYASATAAGALTSPAALVRYVDQMVPIVLGSQRAMSAMVVAELSRQVPPAYLRGGPPIVVPPAAVTGAPLRQKAVEQVYSRPFFEAQRAIAAGKSRPEAIAAGYRRLEKVAVTDLQLAQTHTAREFATQLQRRQPDQSTATGNIVGFRRVLSSKPNHCALCIIASTQRYRSFDLMPIHPGCGCRVAMVLGDSDPGQVLDPRLAQEIHNAVRRDLGDAYVDPGGRNGLAAYRDIIVTNQHGELGPVLGVRDHTFTGPGFVALDSTRWVIPPGDAGGAGST